MGRRTAPWTATDGRDKGKVYLLIELPAAQAEKWAMRALIALNAEPVLLNGGMAALYSIGFRGLYGVSYADAEPLMDEMMSCVQRVEEKVTRPLVEDDIEEVTTRVQLREEVLNLHLGFSLRARMSEWISAQREKASSNTSTSDPSPAS